MCAIIGALLREISRDRLAEVNHILAYIANASSERGRDGRGYMLYGGGGEEREYLRSTARLTSGNETKFIPRIQHPADTAIIIGNLRAEPTTEFVREKSVDDQQPYALGNWSIVHNGTIANDKELRTGALRTTIDSAAIVEMLNIQGDTIKEADPLLRVVTKFEGVINNLVGSYAILAHCTELPNYILVAANYRPVWAIRTDFGWFFASSRDYFPEEYVPIMLEPYSITIFGHEADGMVAQRKSLYKPVEGRNALVVCSGGLDSVVAAAYAKHCLGYNIHLIHFVYGCKAEQKEVDSIKAVAGQLEVGYTIFPMNIYDPEDSPLLDREQEISSRDSGAAGAEYAHEWVPARNLVMLSMATAFAEAKGYDTIVLGNNLEEAGAYPDNEPEFIHKFNKLLPFAVADGVDIQIEMPVGNLMKHEIVALGHEIEAPMHLTWSCYSAGDKHCGHCGPCFMRRTAFNINNIPECITYEDE